MLGAKTKNIHLYVQKMQSRNKTMERKNKRNRTTTQEDKRRKTRSADVPKTQRGEKPVSRDHKALNSFTRIHLDRSVRIDWDWIKIRPGWTLQTKLTTIAICQYLIEQGITFACEAKMKHNNRRADIIVPELYEAQIIEIHDTESTESIQEKTKDYGRQQLTVLAVPANQEQAVKMIDQAWRSMQ